MSDATNYADDSSERLSLWSTCWGLAILLAGALGLITSIALLIGMQ